MCNHNKDNNNYRTDIFQRPTSEMWRPQLNKERLRVPAATVVCSGNDQKCSGCSISVLLYWKISYLYKYIYIHIISKKTDDLLPSFAILRTQIINDACTLPLFAI
jgi:hypothetical protein